MQPATSRSVGSRFGRALGISLAVLAGIIALSCVPILLIRVWVTTKDYAITYRVTAVDPPRRPVTITYQEGGVQRQVQTQTLPWEISWTTKAEGSVGVIARSGDAKGRLRCEIVIDGITANQSDGYRAGALASCGVKL